MQATLSSQQHLITLHLGSCQARLKPQEAGLLREELYAAYERYFSDRSPSSSNKRLSSYLRSATSLNRLDNQQLQIFLQNYPRNFFPILLRVLQKEHPEASHRIQGLLSKHTARVVKEDIESLPPLPLPQVIPALDALQKTLITLGWGSPIELQAKEFLQRLSQLSDRALGLAAGSLASDTQIQLYLLTQQLNLEELNQRLTPYLQIPADETHYLLDEPAICTVLNQVSQQLKRNKTPRKDAAVPLSNAASPSRAVNQRSPDA